MQPAAGDVRRGKTVVVGFADQHSSELPPDAIVRKLVAGPHREPDFEDRALLERFWFDTTAQYAPVRMLSGGERRRLQLVMVLATQPNLLILDEPTNDLDLDTLRSLEAFLDDWPGALVVASHDRAFLDRVADHVLAIDPPTSAAGGVVRRVPGGVAGWLAERSTAKPSKAAKAAKLAAGSASRERHRGRRRRAGAGPASRRSTVSCARPRRRWRWRRDASSELTAQLTGADRSCASWHRSARSSSAAQQRAGRTRVALARAGGAAGLLSDRDDQSSMRPWRRRTALSSEPNTRASTTMPTTRMTIIIAIRPGAAS